MTNWSCLKEYVPVLSRPLAIQNIQTFTWSNIYSDLLVYPVEWNKFFVEKLSRHNCIFCCLQLTSQTENFLKILAICFKVASFEWKDSLIKIICICCLLEYIFNILVVKLANDLFLNEKAFSKVTFKMWVETT